MPQQIPVTVDKYGNPVIVTTDSQASNIDTTLNPHFAPSGKSASDVRGLPIEELKKDGTTFIPGNYQSRQYLADKYYNEQGYLEKIGKRFANATVNVGLGIMETVGLLGEGIYYAGKGIAGDLKKADLDFTNDITEFANRYKNPFDIRFRPTDGTLRGSMSSADWWIDNGFGLLESVASFATVGGGIGTGAKLGTRALAKSLKTAAKLGKKGARFADATADFTARTTAAMSLAYAEGAMSGAVVYKDTYDRHVKTMGEQAARKLAGEAAATTVRINTFVNTALNFPGLAAVFRHGDEFTKAAKAVKSKLGKPGIGFKERLANLSSEDIYQALGPTLGGVVGSSIRESALEGLEEMVNVFAERRGRIRGKLIDQEDIKDSMKAVALSDEGQISFILGALGGVGQNVVMENLMPVKGADGKWTSAYKYRKEEINKFAKQYIENVNAEFDIIDGFETKIANITEKIHTAAAKGQKLPKTEELELKKQLDQARAGFLTQVATRMIDSSNGELLRDYIAGIKDLDTKKMLKDSDPESYQQVLQRRDDQEEYIKQLEAKINDENTSEANKAQLQETVEKELKKLQQTEDEILFYNTTNAAMASGFADYEGDTTHIEAAEFALEVMDEIERIKAVDETVDRETLFSKIEDFVADKYMQKELEETENILDPEVKAKKQEEIKKRNENQKNERRQQQEKERKEREEQETLRETREIVEDTTIKEDSPAAQDTTSTTSKEEIDPNFMGQIPPEGWTPSVPSELNPEGDGAREPITLDITSTPDSNSDTDTSSSERWKSGEMVTVDDLVRPDDVNSLVGTSTIVRMQVNEVRDTLENGNTVVQLKVNYNDSGSLLNASKSANIVTALKPKAQEGEPTPDPDEDLEPDNDQDQSDISPEEAGLYIDETIEGFYLDDFGPESNYLEDAPPLSLPEDIDSTGDPQVDGIGTPFGIPLDMEGSLDASDKKSPAKPTNALPSGKIKLAKSAIRKRGGKYSNNVNDIEFKFADSLDGPAEGDVLSVDMELLSDKELGDTPVYYKGVRYKWRDLATKLKNTDEWAMYLPMPVYANRDGGRELVGYIPSVENDKRNFNRQLRRAISEGRVKQLVVDEKKMGPLFAPRERSEKVIRTTGEAMHGYQPTYIGTLLDDDFNTRPTENGLFPTDTSDTAHRDGEAYFERLNTGKDKVDIHHGGAIWVKVPVFKTKDGKVKYKYYPLLNRKFADLPQGKQLAKTFLEGLLAKLKGEDFEMPGGKKYNLKTEEGTRAWARNFVSVWNPIGAQREQAILGLRRKFGSNNANVTLLHWYMSQQKEAVTSQGAFKHTLLPYFYINKEGVLMFNSQQSQSASTATRSIMRISNDARDQRLIASVEKAIEKLDQADTLADSFTQNGITYDNLLLKTIASSYMNVHTGMMNDVKAQQNNFGDIFDGNYVETITATSMQMIPFEDTHNATVNNQFFLTPIQEQEEQQEEKPKQIVKPAEPTRKKEPDTQPDTEGFIDLGFLGEDTDSDTEGDVLFREADTSGYGLSIQTPFFEELSIQGLEDTDVNLNSITTMAEEVAKNLMKDAIANPEGELELKTSVRQGLLRFFRPIVKLYNEGKKSNPDMKDPDIMNMKLKALYPNISEELLGTYVQSSLNILAIARDQAAARNVLEMIGRFFKATSIVKTTNPTVQDAKEAEADVINQEQDISSEDEVGSIPDFEEFSSMLTNHLKTASERLKALMMFVQDRVKLDDGTYGPVKNAIGQDSLVGYSRAFNVAKSVLADLPPDWNIMRNALLKAAERNPFLSHLVDVVENGVKQGDTVVMEPMVNLFVYTMTSHKLDMRFINVRVGKDNQGNNVYSYVNTNANSEDLKIAIRNEWATGITTSEIMGVDSEGGPLLNGEKALEIATQLQTEVMEGIQYARFSEILGRAGIRISEDTFNDLAPSGTLQEMPVAPDKVRAFARTPQDKINSLVMFIARIADGSYPNGSIYIGQDSVRITVASLVEMEAAARVNDAVQSFRVSDKNVYGFSYNRLSYDINRKLLDNDRIGAEYREELSKDTFSGVDEEGASYLLESMMKSKADRNKVGLSYVSLEPFKSEAGNADQGFEGLSEIDHEFFKFVAMFSNKDVATTLFPTMSDKKVAYLLTLPKFTYQIDQSGRPSDETLEHLYRYMVAPEVKRIKEFLANLDEDGKTPYKEADYVGDIFYLFPQLNKVAFSANSKEINLSKESLKKALGDILQKSIQDKAAEWQNFGFANKLPLDYANNTPASDIMNAAADYIIHSHLGIINGFQLYIGDPARFYKGVKNGLSEEALKAKGTKKEDGSKLKPAEFHRKFTYHDLVAEVNSTFANVGKRLAMQNAPGSSLRTDRTSLDEKYEVNGWNFSQNFRVLYTQDPEGPSAHVKDIEKVLKHVYPERYEDMMKSYNEIASADAQAYVSPQEQAWLIWRKGDMTDAEFDSIMETLNSSNPKLSNKQLRLLFSPLKPVYSGVYNDGGARKVKYIKMSTFPLIPQLTEGMAIHDLAVFMQGGPDGKGPKINMVAHKTAVKVGFPKDVKEIWEDGKINQEALANNIKEGQSDLLPREFLRIQLEVPYGGKKKEIVMGTQAKKLLFANIREYLPEEANEFTRLHKKLIFQKVVKFGKRLGFDMSNINTLEAAMKHIESNDISKEKFLEAMKEEAEGRGYAPFYAEALSPDGDGGSRIPFWQISGVRKLESMINSMINQGVNKLKMAGSSYVLGSEEGFVSLDDVDKLTYSKIAFTKRFKGKLSYRDFANGDMRAQVILPMRLRKNDGTLVDIKTLVDEDGLIDPNKIDPELLTMMGYRIPTQGLNSMSSIEVVGFLPAEFGDLIIAPKEFVAQMGSDFDVDKMFMYHKYHYTNKRGKLVPVRRGEQGTKNDIFDIYQKVLQDPRPEIQAQIMQPLEYGNLPAIANRISDTETNSLHPTHPDYQRFKYLQARSGKAGVGSFSLDVVLHAQLQGKDVTLTEALSIGRTQGFIKLGQLDTLSGKQTISDTIVAYQSVSVDNENLQLMGKLNINSETFSAIRALAMTGFNEEQIQSLIMQPAIFNYVAELAKLKGIAVEKGFSQFDISHQALQNTLTKIFPEEHDIISQITTDENLVKFLQFKATDRYAGGTVSFTSYNQQIGMYGNDLISLGENGSKFAKKNQVQALIDFLTATDTGNQLAVAESAANTDSAGIGKSFQDSQDKRDRLKRVLGSDVINKLSDVLPSFDENDALITIPDSIPGIHNAVSNVVSKKVLDSFDTLFEEVTALSEMLNSSLSYTANRTSIKGLLADDLRLYIANNPNNPLLKGSVPTFLRDRLLKKGPGSLGSIITYIKNNSEMLGISEDIISSITVDNSDKYSEFHALRYNRDIEDQFATFKTYVSFANLINDERLIFDEDTNPFGNFIYTTQHLADDIAAYALLFTDASNPNGLARFIPVDYLEKIGYVDFMETSLIDYNNERASGERETFLSQFAQHNHRDIRNMPGGKRRVLQGDGTIKITSTSKAAPPRFYKDEVNGAITLYQRVRVDDTVGFYKRMPIAGGTIGRIRIKEYDFSGASDVKNLGKSIIPMNHLRGVNTSNPLDLEGSSLTPKEKTASLLREIARNEEGVYNESQVKLAIYLGVMMNNLDMHPRDVGIFSGSDNLLGYYDPINDAIMINASVYDTNGNIDLESYADVLLEEVTHFLTASVIKNPQTDAQKQAVANLDKFYQDTKAKFGSEFPRQYSKLEEFVAAVVINKPLLDKLANETYPGSSQSFLHKLFGFLKALIESLGLNFDNPTVRSMFSDIDQVMRRTAPVGQVPVYRKDANQVKKVLDNLKCK